MNAKEVQTYLTACYGFEYNEAHYLINEAANSGEGIFETHMGLRVRLVFADGEFTVMPEIFCCQWVPYPQKDKETECPACHSVFAVKDESNA